MDKGTAVVTGAGTRLGRAIAKALGEDGWAMALHYNSSAEGAEELAAELRDRGGRAEPVQQDLSDYANAGRLIDRAAEALGGPVRVLVNSASTFDKDSLSDMTAETWHKLLDVNAAAPAFLMSAMAKQADGAGGAIVNILDTQLDAPSPNRFSYFVGKAALEMATRLAALDLAGQGIRVNAVAPGLVLPTGQTQEQYEARQAKTPLGVGLGPDDIVAAVRYLIAAPQVTGQVLRVDGGQSLMGFGNSKVG